MICDKCKTEVSSTAKFCPKCGSKVEAASQPARWLKAAQRKAGVRLQPGAK